MRLEARCRVQTLELAAELERELTGTLGEYGELDARGARVQNENRVGRCAHS